MCSDEDLDLVESAVNRLLQRQEEIAEEVNPERRAGFLAGLIDEVREMRSKKAAEQKFIDKPEAASSVDSDRVLINPDANLGANAGEHATEAAVKAAVAAANAAQAAADAVAKNSQIIEVLLETVKSQQQEQEQELFVQDPDNEEQQHDVKQKKSDKRRQKVSALIKDVRKQNLVTHIILGVMVITTAIWRYKEISWFLRFRKVVSNPLEAVGGIFGGGSVEHTSKYKEEVEAKPLQLPHLELPELPQLFHKTEAEEKTTSSP